VIALGLAGMLALGTLGTVAFAATPTPGPAATPTSGQGQDYRQVFLTKLAGVLGLDQTKLTDAIKQAETETIDQALQDGNLAKNQADEMKQRVQNGDTGFLGGFGGRGFGGPGGGGPGGPGPRGMGGVNMQTVEQAAADKLGLTLDDLRTQIHSGISLADIAKDKGVSETDVRSAMAAAAKTQLDQSVKDGKLTQTQADDVLQQIQQGGSPAFGPGPRGRLGR